LAEKHSGQQTLQHAGVTVWPVNTPADTKLVKSKFFFLPASFINSDFPKAEITWRVRYSAFHAEYVGHLFNNGMTKKQRTAYANHSAVVAALGFEIKHSIPIREFTRQILRPADTPADIQAGLAEITAEILFSLAETPDRQIHRQSDTMACRSCLSRLSSQRYFSYRWSLSISRPAGGWRRGVRGGGLARDSEEGVGVCE
jgi:hypothetical protein